MKFDVWQTGSTRLAEITVDPPFEGVHNYEPRYIAILISEALLDGRFIPHRLMPTAARWSKLVRINDADDVVLTWVTFDPEDGTAHSWLAYEVN